MWDFLYKKSVNKIWPRRKYFLCYKSTRKTETGPPLPFPSLPFFPPSRFFTSYCTVLYCTILYYTVLYCLQSPVSSLPVSKSLFASRPSRDSRDWMPTYSLAFSQLSPDSFEFFAQHRHAMSSSQKNEKMAETAGHWHTLRAHSVHTLHAHSVHTLRATVRGRWFIFHSFIII